MESTPDTETALVWTDEKHLQFLNTMEASFVRTMLHHHHYAVVSPQPLRLDRYLPDTSESTLDSKRNKDSMGRSRGRRTKRRSTKNQLQIKSSAEQAISQPESAGCVIGGGGDDKEPIDDTNV